MAATVVVALLAGACSGGEDSEDDTASTTGVLEGDGTMVIKMFDNYYRPDALTVTAGSTVTFDLVNVGQLPHNMHIASLRGVYRESPWLSEPALSNPGQKGRLTWEVPSEPGVYKFRCDIHEVEMVGTVTVQ
jgi:plastocyanin